ncbi:hypothetical protein GCM10009675_37700 [Prauserella alba]|uniref:Uncharacterized protein n=1 Tax=Prauserella alba TaxID=176898 RepID=A0ABP4G401_9PSEU
MATESTRRPGAWAAGPERVGRHGWPVPVRPGTLALGRKHGAGSGVVRSADDVTSAPGFRARRAHTGR